MASTFSAMEFEGVVSYLREILDDSSEGNGFIVAGGQSRPENPEDFEGDYRSVRVYYQQGVFNTFGYSKNFSHELTIIIELRAACASEGDLDVINDPDATVEEKAAALLAIQDAEALVDASYDELVRNVFQIVMDNRHKSLGSPNTVSGRNISLIEKDPMQQVGSLVFQTGKMVFNCKVDEKVLGLIPVPAGPVVEIDLITDGTGAAGVLVEEP